MEKRTRPKQVKFWVTEDELKEINDKVSFAQLTKQEYLLRSALNKKITIIPGLKEILLELSREGNSLGKIQRALTEDGQADKEELIKVQQRLMELYALINKTLKDGKGDE